MGICHSHVSNYYTHKITKLKTQIRDSREFHQIVKRGLNVGYNIYIEDDNLIVMFDMEIATSESKHELKEFKSLCDVLKFTRNIVNDREKELRKPAKVK